MNTRYLQWWDNHLALQLLIIGAGLALVLYFVVSKQVKKKGLK